MIDEQRKMSFGKLSGRYDEVRPDYPEALVDDVIAFSQVPPGGKILEIGTGTGKATRPFAERGYAITALDISREQMAIAKRNLGRFSRITFMVSSFEQAHLPANSFDLIFAAQAFHWIDPATGYAKASALLKRGGCLALFSNFQSRTAILERRMRKAYAKHCPDYPGEVEFGTLRTLRKRCNASGLFGKAKRRTYLRDIEYPREKFLSFIGTYSWVSTLPREKKRQLFMELGRLLDKRKKIGVPTESILLIARKKDAPHRGKRQLPARLRQTEGASNSRSNLAQLF